MGGGVGGVVDVRCACDCSELGDEERVLGGERLWSVSCGLWLWDTETILAMVVVEK